MATIEEQEAFLWLQGRMVQLLLRHDVQRLGSSFAERLGALFDDAHHTGLQPYRELAVLIYLREELLESILPRIKRRLSFLAPHELNVEELPPRGRVDWARTMAVSLRDRPGEPPLEVQTRQRRRHFATAENLLTVCTILEYRAVVQAHLDGEADTHADSALRHPLREIVDRCTRELAFPQFIGLVRTCERIVSGDADQTTAELEESVEEQLLPGRNSAYDDLLTWRRQLAALRLLDRPAGGERAAMLGADPARDNYLYQLWLFYEFANLLAHEHRLKHWDVRRMSITFTWGSGEDTTTYVLQHDRGLQHHWERAPGVRPDLYVYRAKRDSVWDGKSLIWREPGYVLDAKYYRPTETPRAPSSPVKRMIADLHLTGERHGALLFAFQRDEGLSTPALPKGAEAVVSDIEGDPFEQDSVVDTPDIGAIGTQTVSQQTSYIYRIHPVQDAAHAIQQDVHIDVWRVRPEIREDANQLRLTLTTLLDSVHAALQERIPVTCHGFLPDPDTTNPGGTQPARCATCGDILAFCPKPHVAAGRIDRVCPRCHCLRSRQHCHIIGRGTYTAPPFVKRVLSREDLLASVATLRKWLRDAVTEQDESEAADQARDQLLRMIGELTESYVKLTRADTAQTEYGLREWVFGPYWSDQRHQHGLPAIVRNMLISGEFVWMQFQSSTIEDWAACAVQYTRALEYELHRRLYEPCGGLLVTKDGLAMGPKQFTIGTPMFIYIQRKQSDNWKTLLERVGQPNGISEAALKQHIIDIEAVRQDRNKVAHTEHVDAALARKIREAILGRQGEPGLLYRLVASLRAPV